MQKRDVEYKEYAKHVLRLIGTENKTISKDGWKIKVIINLRLFEDWSFEARIENDETDEDYDQGLRRYFRFCDRINLDGAHYIMGIRILADAGDECLSDVDIDCYST